VKILDLYTILRENPRAFVTDERLRPFQALARNWEIDETALAEWFSSRDGIQKRAVAEAFVREVPSVVTKVESVFQRELPGLLLLMPSFGEFDGFARYDHGEHQVMLGIDFPDADLDYLKALTAHELSHVYRDHAPEVWRHLGKPLREVSRKEYLDAGTAEEHLASEGLATLFSQMIFPEIAPHVHHFYEPEEWSWCLENEAKIEAALLECLAGDADVWSFYGESRVGRGSPSRLQYFWAAKRIQEALSRGSEARAALVRLHESPVASFSSIFSTSKK